MKKGDSVKEKRAGCEVRVAGYELRVARYALLVAGFKFRIMDAGTGCWLLGSVI